METILPRVSLVDQAAHLLQQEIAQGRWGEWLPNERELCVMLGVSRNTLRAALAELARRRVVKAAYPRGTRILARPAGRVKVGPSGIVGLLSPQSIDGLRPNVALIIDALRAQLAEIGVRLHLHHGEHYFSPNPERALQRLVASHHHDAWVLVLANEAVKRWFHRRDVPCVVSGSCGPDLPLPFVDLDYHALGRHAAGQMLGAGHRRLGLLVEQSSVTGKLDCERGFREAAEGARHADVEARVLHHRGTIPNILTALEQMLASPHPPTALFIVNPHHFLLALTFLQKRGVQIPEELSLICADDDPFLAFVHPAPSRYRFDAHAFAGRLFRLIQRVSNGLVVPRRAVRIIPRYERGATLVAPRAGNMVH